MIELGLNRESLVKEFHESFDCPINESWTDDMLILRAKLIMEEAEEVVDALKKVFGDPQPGCEEAVLKELCDLQYVLSGTAVSLGLDLEEAFTRVHKSNMSKLGDDGKPIYRYDGKVLKGPNYKEPYLSDLVG